MVKPVGRAGASVPARRTTEGRMCTKIKPQLELVEFSIGKTPDLSRSLVRRLLLLLQLMMLGFTSSCITYSDNVRSSKLTRYSVVGVRHPHYLLFETQPYCIANEDVAPLPQGQDYLLLVNSYIEGFWIFNDNAGLGKANVTNAITVKNQGAPIIKITPLGIFSAESNHLKQLFLLSVSQAHIGESCEASISISVKQDSLCKTELTVIEQKTLSKTETLRFAITNADAKLMYGWNTSPILIGDITQYRVIKDLGEVKIAPRGVIADIMEPFVSLKKKALRRGANAITDVRVWNNDNNEISIFRYGVMQGLRARAVVVDLSHSR